jgi:DNA polymerase elongation subunit (family B)
MASKPLFHILDSMAQDLEVEETEDTRAITVYETTGADGLSDDDGEVRAVRRGAKKGDDGGQQQDRTKLRMMVFLFGNDAEGRPVRARVENFKPYFYVRIPSAAKVVQTNFKNMLNDKLKATARWMLKDGVIKVTFEQRKVLYGYTADQLYTFARLEVLSIDAFRALRRVFLTPDTMQPKFQLYAGEDPLEVFEANLDPMLRFFHLRDLKPAGWVQPAREDSEWVVEDPPEEEAKRGGIPTTHYSLNWEDISPCVAPPVAAAPFLHAFWDIECYSSSGEFPLAKKGYDRLAKQLFELAADGEDAGSIIYSSAVKGEHIPNFDELKSKKGELSKADRDTLNSFSEEYVCSDMKCNHTSCINPTSCSHPLCTLCKGRKDFLDGLDQQLKGKAQLSVSSQKDRIEIIKKHLGSFLRRALPIAGDPIIQIGVVLTRGGAERDKHIFVLNSCDAVPGATVYSYETEKELLLGWAQKMEEWNPDVMIGYNVFGFDERYVWERAEELRITEDRRIQSLSRLLDMQRKVELETKMLSSSALGDNEMKIWTAYGRLQVDLFHYIKRSFSLPAYKLDYVCQHFMSGKLSGVDVGAESWLLKTKSTGDAVVGRYVTLLDETGDTVVEKMRITAIREMEGLVVEAPQGEDAADLAASAPDAVKWAVVKDDVSPQDIFRLHRGTAADRATVAAYCIQDCDLTVELYKKLDVFNNAMAMANACSVPIGYIFTRGQGIKIESLIFKECDKRKQCVIVMPQQPRVAPGEEGTAAAAAAQEESYEGAIVLTPNPGFYFKSPIGVADFASLYPSTIISENISHDTLVWSKDYSLDGRFLGYSYGSKDDEGTLLAQRDEAVRKRDALLEALDGEMGKTDQIEAKLAEELKKIVSWTDIEFDIWGVKEGDTRKQPEKVKRGLRVCRYAQPADGSKGTLPQIVQGLLAARKAKRKEAEKESDPFKKALLDAEQLAYKLTANSLYGQLGSGTFKIRLQHLAASVTAYGRKQIMFAKAAIEQFYGPAAGRRDCCAETVYGDTDSLFINFNVRDPATGELLTGREAIVATQHLTEEAGKWVTRCLKPPHDFEYDKVFSPFIIFSKKRYVGNKYEESPDDYYQNSMGIATKRRDYAGIVKVIYGGALRILLTERNIEAAANFVRDKLFDLAEGRVSMTQLTMTKSLRAEYKSPTPPAHKILAQRITARDPGNAPASGDRISFLYVLPPVGQMASKIQGERIETPAFIKEKKLEVDVKFYMEHQLMNPISQLFALVVEQLPGCVAPAGRSWEQADTSDREYAAAEYLFRDALNACDKSATRRFATKMFGLAPATPAAAPKGSIGGGGERRAAEPLPLPARTMGAAPTAAPKSAAKPKAQTKLTSMFLERQLLKGLEAANGGPRRSERTASRRATEAAAAVTSKTGKTVSI